LNAVVPHPAPTASRGRALTDPATGHRRDAAIYPRDALPPGAQLTGPALIVEDETTTIVPAGWSAIVNAGGQILLEHLP
jgi:N-methylhydantoinase A